MKRIVITVLGLFTLTASANAHKNPALCAFIAGDYTVIGREPETGKAYVGSMRIDNLSDNTVRMLETVPQRANRVWEGRFRPAEPGEGWVLFVRSKRGSMACLVSSDLDNFARLTCRWGNTKKPVGLMALFPMLY